MTKFPLIARTTLAVAIAAFSLAPMQAMASVTLVIDALDILDNTGSFAPLNTVGLLIVDTSGGTNLSPVLTLGENIAVGTTLAGTTDKIIAVTDINNSTATTGEIELVVNSMIYGSGLGTGVAAGQKFGIIWLVNQSLNVTTVQNGYYGEFSDYAGNYSNPWVLPADGSAVGYDMTTISEGGSVPEPDGIANFSVGGEAPGSTNTWFRATGGKWETATNWSSGFAPSTDDAADVITNASTKTVTVDATTVLSNSLNGCMIVNNLSIAGTANTTNTLSLNNAGSVTPLDILNSFTITANGMVLVTNSILQVNTLLGGGFNIDGGIVVSGSGSLIATTNLTNVGNNGVGQMTVSNGTVLVNQIDVGNNAGSQGTLTIAGGTTTFLSDFNMGLSAGATGAVWITGGQVTAGNSTAIGVSGVGRLTVSNGTMSANGIVLGYDPGSSGTLSVAGGTNSIGGYGLDIGNYLSTGTLWMTGGQLVNFGTVTLGWDGAGQMAVSNGVFLGANMYVGFDINSQGGTLTIAGGTVSLSSYLSVGRFFGATGAVWVTGGQLAVTNSSISIGDGGDNGGGIGQMTVSNGTWLAQGVYVGTYFDLPGDLPLGSGTLTIAGGASSISSVLDIANGVNTTGAVWVTAGQLNVANSPIVVGVTGSGNMTVSNGSVTVGSLIVTNNINGSIINTNTFTLAGGTLNSAGTAVTNGLTFAAGNGITAATFVLNGGVHSFANSLEIRNNATLSGCGTVSGSVTVDAGGTIISTCSDQTFSGAVTNNGNIVAANGTTINFLGPVVNNGQINATNGTAQFYGGIVNNGTILTNTIPAIGTNSWIDGSGKWETAANWSLGSAPSLSDSSDYITNAASKTVAIDAATTNTPSAMTISNLTVSAPLGSTNTLYLNDAGLSTPLDILNSFTITTNGMVLLSNSVLRVDGLSGGSLSIDGGVVLSGNGLVIVTNTSTAVGNIGDGRMTVSNGTWLAQTVDVGNTNGSQGALTIAGGTSSVSASLYVGNSANATGDVWITGGLLTAPNTHTFVGNNGVGEMMVSNGIWLAGFVDVGNNAGSQGTLTIAGGVSSLSSNLDVGASANATGAVSLTGGQLVVTNNITHVGDSGVGQMMVSNGTWLAQVVKVGNINGAQGTLTIAGGTNSLLSDLDVGVNANATGAVWVTGGQLILTNDVTYVGDSGIGQMTVSNGTWLAQDVSVGYTNDSQGTLTFAGGISSLSSNLDLGRFGSATGTVWMSGGQLIVAALAVVGSHNVGQMTVSNGTWLVQAIDVGNNTGSQGTLTVAGGTISESETLKIGASANATGAVWVTGGQLNVANNPIVVGVSGSGQMTVSNGSVTVGSLIVTNNINGSIINSNTFTLAGGTLNSGGTAVTNGLTFAAGNGMAAATFVLNGGVHSFANNLEIRNNATVSGCGTVTGNVVVDPGGMIVADCGGTLNFAGTVTNNATVFAVNGTTINFYGPVVNNGVINATNGLAQFYGGIINTGTGTVLNPNSWIGGNGKWENSNDWSLGVSPSLNDLVDLIANGGNNTVTIDATTTGALAGATMTISNLILRANTLALNNAGTNVPLQVLDQFVMTNGASLLISNSAMEVYGGPVVPIDGSDISLLSGSFAIGTNTLALGSVGNVSTLTVAGGTALMGDLNVGVSGNGTGTVLVTGGTLSVTNATGTGQLSLYNGAFALSNGATVVADLYTNVGGTFTNLGGTFVITSHATVNQGTATFSSGTTQIGSNFTVAATAGSTGSVYVTGGSLIATNATTTIGSGNGSVGSLTVSNATVAIGQTQIGGNANSVGMLTVQDGGQMSVSSNLLVASFFNSTGMVNVAGGQLTATNGVIGFGNNGSIVTGYGYGQMNVTNGTVLANKILLGSSTGGHGDLTIQPNGVVNLVGSNALLVPDGVEIDGGELTIENGDIQCGQASATGTYFPCTVTMTGGVATVAIVYVGYTGGGTLTISGGQMGVSPLLDVGYSSGSAGAIVMSGGTLTAGAVILGDSGIGQLSLSDNGIIQVSSSFSVGASGAAGAAGAVTLAGGALMVSVPVYVGAGSVWVSGGQLQATSLLLGYNNYGVGQLTISNGSVQVNSLVLTNGANSQIALFGGTLESGGTVVTNNHRFVVGNGSTAATFNLMAGVHWFGNGLEITSNSVLSGCGTVNGNVVVDPGGLVLANCGTLTFNNVVTNNGVLLADGGSTLESFGNLINNGSIDAINGSTNFHTGLINHGSILTAAGVAISLVSPSGQNFTVQVQSLAGHTYQLQYSASMVSPTWTNTGAPQAGTGGVLTFTDYGATADPQRFYRVLVTAP